MIINCRYTVDSHGSGQSLAYDLFLMDLVVHACGSRLGGRMSMSALISFTQPNLSPKKKTFLENALISEIDLGVRNKFLFSKLMVQLVIWSA